MIKAGNEAHHPKRGRVLLKPEPVGDAMNAWGPGTTAQAVDKVTR